MTNSKTTAIIGWMFLVASFFVSYEVNIIYASIFFAAHFIIETIEKKNYVDKNN